MISRKEAQDIVTFMRDDDFAHGRKPETWYTYHNHVYGTAVLAEHIAKKLNMDSEKCYIMGLLHDIGKIEGDRQKRFHGVVGYEMANRMGLDPIVGRISMLHTFPYNEIPASCTLDDFFLGNRNDMEFTHRYVENEPYDDCDLLIQLTDNMAFVRGPTTLEFRIKEWCDRNHKPFLPEHIDPSLKMKAYFDSKLGCSIYDLFDQIDKSYLID